MCKSNITEIYLKKIQSPGIEADNEVPILSNPINKWHMKTVLEKNGIWAYINKQTFQICEHHPHEKF